MSLYHPNVRVRRYAMTLATLALSLAALMAPTPWANSQEANPDVSSAKRVVAIGGSVTEILYALGEEGRIVGRDSTSVYPEAALAVPDVGYMRAISPEGVLGIDPDAILTLEGSGPPEAIEVLRKASIPFVTVPDKFDEAGILAKIETIGTALGVKGKSDALVASVKADIDAALAKTANLTERKRVLFVLSLQGGKVMASGTNSAADGIIRMAGGVNAITEFEGYKPVTDEAIISARPDLILMMDRAGDHAAANAQMKEHPALGQTPAVKADAVLRMDGAYLLGFGPRTASAARDLAKALYGDAIVN
ncbi:MAG: ABC transporter substrate-binding protein [Mesorhizobium sp.]